MTRLRGKDAHSRANGKVHCYDFFCPAKQKPHIKFIDDGVGWELYYVCEWGAEHWSYGPLRAQLEYACKLCPELDK